MLKVRRRVSGDAVAQAVVTLPFEIRQRSRFTARLSDGREIGFILPRGAVLRDGELFRADDDQVVEVRAAREPVSIASGLTPHELARVCYHLGNRHVPIQIGAESVRYLRDHVLDALMAELGLTVEHASEPFEPEVGAYASGHRH